MKYTYLFSVISIVLILVGSCETNIQLKINTNEKRLLIDGSFTTDSTYHSIELYRSGNLTTGQPQAGLPGAQISITDNNETFYYEESDSVPGLYLTTTKCRGKGGCTYTLSITGVDIDENGTTEKYTASGLMPEPVVFDTLVAGHSFNGDGDLMIIHSAMYKIKQNSPACIFPYILVNNQVTNNGTIGERLGTNKFDEGFIVQPIVNRPGQEIQQSIGFGAYASNVNPGDSVCFVGMNFTQQQYDFLKEFNDNTNGDTFEDTVYDQLRMPVNLSTNIEPADKAAGYFFIYSVSRIKGKFKK